MTLWNLGKTTNETSSHDPYHETNEPECSNMAYALCEFSKITWQCIVASRLVVIKVTAVD